MKLMVLNTVSELGLFPGPVDGNCDLSTAAVKADLSFRLEMVEGGHPGTMMPLGIIRNKCPFHSH
jgi:hypothetical protein